MSHGLLDSLAIADLVALAYGNRARLADLESMRERGDRSPELRRLLEEASRTVNETDAFVLDLAQREPATGWAIFDLIKGTHNGSIQRLSQRVKERLPARDDAYRSRGFTVVELLIVIVVVGILAAITLVAYNGVQNRAYDGAIQNDLRNIAQRLEFHKVQNGSYPTGAAQLSTLDLKVTKSAYSSGYFNGSTYFNVLYCWPTTAQPDRYALIALGRSGNNFQYGGSGTGAYSGTVNGSSSMCTQAGSSITDGNSRDWFYFNSSWQSFVGGN